MHTEKPTTATAYKDAADRLKQQICKLLQWDEMQYAEFQYQNGIAYLMWYLPCDEYAREQLLRSRLYWSWFKNQWNADDMLVLEVARDNDMPLQVAREIYTEIHCPRVLACEIKPNAIVLSSLKTH